MENAYNRNCIGSGVAKQQLTRVGLYEHCSCLESSGEGDITQTCI